MVSSRNDRYILNVGGKLFETSGSTLRASGPDSILSALSTRSRLQSDGEPVFIDRDPEIFSVLLSLLRSNRLPSAAAAFTKQELLQEALYYGLEATLKSAMSPPPFTGIDASVVSTVHPAADPIPSTFTVDSGDGSLWIAHGGQISGYDWTLSHTGTVRTHLDEIASLRRVCPDLAAVASGSDPGLHFYALSSGLHAGSVHWADPSDPRIYKARVTSIADSSAFVFASLECPHRENCILQIDKSTLKVVSELGRQGGSSVKTMTAGKMTYMPQNDVIVASSVTCGAFGYSGYIKLLDSRSGEVVWETNEPGSGRSSRFGDPFADVDVDVEGSCLFKVCSKSGDLAVADLRRLSEDPWVYVKEKNPSLSNTGGGGGGILHCYKKQVFIGRAAGLEVWCRAHEEGIEEGAYRRNFVDKAADSERGAIKRIEGGGDRLFVSRENVEGIEVWESSHSSGAITVL